MATPDPYQSWSGAPKHWVHVPAQRKSPPAPEQLDAAAGSPSGQHGGDSRRGWTVVTIAVAVAVAVAVVVVVVVAFLLIGTGSPITLR